MTGAMQMPPGMMGMMGGGFPGACVQLTVWCDLQEWLCDTADLASSYTHDHFSEQLCGCPAF